MVSIQKIMVFIQKISCVTLPMLDNFKLLDFVDCLTWA